MVLCLLYRVFSELKYLENNVDYIEERGKLEFLEKDPLEQGQEPVKACFVSLISQGVMGQIMSQVRMRVCLRSELVVHDSVISLFQAPR